MKFAIGITVGKIISNVMPGAISAVSIGLLGYFLQQINSGSI